MQNVLISNTILERINEYKIGIADKKDDAESKFYYFVSNDNKLAPYFNEKANYYKNLINGNEVKNIQKNILSVINNIFLLINESKIIELEKLINNYEYFVKDIIYAFKNTSVLTGSYQNLKSITTNKENYHCLEERYTKKLYDQGEPIINDLNIYLTCSQYHKLCRFFDFIFEKARILNINDKEYNFEDLITNKTNFEELNKQLSNLINNLEKITKYNADIEKETLTAYYFFREYFNANTQLSLDSDYTVFTTLFDDRLNEAASIIVNDLQSFWLNQMEAQTLLPVQVQQPQLEADEILKQKVPAETETQTTTIELQNGSTVKIFNFLKKNKGELLKRDSIKTACQKPQMSDNTLNTYIGNISNQLSILLKKQKEEFITENYGDIISNIPEDIVAVSKSQKPTA